MIEILNSQAKFTLSFPWTLAEKNILAQGKRKIKAKSQNWLYPPSIIYIFWQLFPLGK